MTNGEKIKEIFPNSHIDERSHTVFVGYEAMTFRRDWWNAEYREPTTKNNLGVDCIDRAEVLKLMKDNWHTHNGDWAMQESMDDIRALPSVTPQEPILEKINKMKSEIADSLEFWDYSPNNNPLARDMLETLTHFWGDMREVEK